MTSYDELLQNLSSRLQEIAAEHPENESLRGTVARLSEIDVDAPDARSDVRAVVRNMIESLETEGLWPTSPEDEEFLKQLNAGLHRAGTRHYIAWIRVVTYLRHCIRHTHTACGAAGH